MFVRPSSIIHIRSQQQGLLQEKSPGLTLRAERSEVRARTCIEKDEMRPKYRF
jgi:hypothetical protein